MLTISHPGIPYCEKIPNLDVGSMIQILGNIPYRCHRFTIDFINPCSFSYHEPDLPFHISCRFDERVIVRNSRVNGEWQHEERQMQYFPLEQGKQFNMIILVEPREYKVAIDGRHFTEFRHRMPFNTVEKLAIGGDVCVTQLIIQGRPQQIPQVPTICPPYMRPPVPHMPSTPLQPYQPTTGSHPIIHPIQNPPVPFLYKINGGLRPGLSVFITGMPEFDAERFQINFQKGSTIHPSDIALHFNPRFEHENRCIVRNSLINGNWGPEEWSGGLPLERGAQFEIQFRIQPDKFLIAINGCHFTEYRHRMLPLQNIDTLRICGEVKLRLIRFD